MNFTRRSLMVGAGATAASALLARAAGAQSFPFTPNQRYPDPAVQILDPSFGKYRLYSSTVEQVATGMRWAEGPAYFCLLYTSPSPRDRTRSRMPSSA